MTPSFIFWQVFRAIFLELHSKTYLEEKATPNKLLPFLEALCRNALVFGVEALGRWAGTPGRGLLIHEAPAEVGEIRYLP